MSSLPEPGSFRSLLNTSLPLGWSGQLPRWGGELPSREQALPGGFLGLGAQTPLPNICFLFSFSLWLRTENRVFLNGRASKPWPSPSQLWRVCRLTALVMQYDEPRPHSAEDAAAFIRPCCLLALLRPGSSLLLGIL